METVTVAKHRRDSNRSVRHRNAKLRKFANPETQERIGSETQFLCASLSLILKVGTSDGDRSPQSRNAISNAREKRKFHKGQAQFLVVFHFDSSSSQLEKLLLELRWSRIAAAVMVAFLLLSGAAADPRQPGAAAPSGPVG